MKIPFSSLCLGAVLLGAAPAAFAQGNLPPGVASGAAQRAQQSDVLYWYGLLPPAVFTAFGNVDRVQLLQIKGVIYDTNRGYIEIPMPGDANQNDVEKLQVKLYKSNGGLMVGVSQIVWNQTRVPAALAFYALDANGRLFDVTRQVFPFDLNPKTNGAAPANAPGPGAPDGDNANAVAPINAYLPRAGTSIVTAAAETEEARANYLWNGNIFVKRDAAGDDGTDAPATDDTVPDVPGIERGPR